MLVEKRLVFSISAIDIRPTHPDVRFAVCFTLFFVTVLINFAGCKYLQKSLTVYSGSKPPIKTMSFSIYLI